MLISFQLAPSGTAAAEFGTAASISTQNVEISRLLSRPVWTPVQGFQALAQPADPAPLRVGPVPGAASALAAQANTAIPALSGLPWRSGMGCYNRFFEGWRGRKADVYVQFVGRASRSAVLSRIRSGAIGAFAGRPGRLVLSWPMLPRDVAGQFRNCASGSFDPYVRGAAVALKGHGILDPIIRLGWEPNGHFPWSLGHYPTEDKGYIACFQRQAKIFRSVLPDVAIEWTNRRLGEIPYSVERTYPGEAYVDMVGLMIYDRHPPHPNQAAWDRAYWARDRWGGPIGLGRYLELAQRYGKKLAVSEWAVSNNNNDPHSTDNPFFVTKMFEFFGKNKAGLAYESYFNCGSPSSGYQLSPQTFNPKTAAEYRRRYRP
jgi:hypothetical protein